MANTQSIPNHKPESKSNPLESLINEAIATGDYCIATEADARLWVSERDELCHFRLKAAGGSVFKRPSSPHWQLKYRVEGKWRHQSSSGTENRRDAERLLAWKVYEASADLLPGTASIEQILDMLLNVARVRKLKALGRLERPVKALRAKLPDCGPNKLIEAAGLIMPLIDKRGHRQRHDSLRAMGSAARIYRRACRRNPPLDS